jgi:16S rRNA (cytosine967-C5)-methyltransferase
VSGPTARGVAAGVLVRVEKDRAFASAALEAELGRAVQMTSRDRALATELVYGPLRVRPWLEAELGKRATKGITKLDATTRAHLCVAAYQLFFLSRVPAFAAVSECVEAVRRMKGERVAAFANAVLRKTSRDLEATTHDDAARASMRRAAVTMSTAPWLREALVRALGEEGSTAFLEASLDVPPVCLRVERAEERDGWLEKLRASGDAGFELGRVSPLAILARGAGKPQSLPGWSEGAWAVQEEGSQLVALALGAREGERILDACAGRGNKTAILARAVGERGAVDAADLHAAKLEQLERELARVGLRARATHAVDWRVGAGDIGEEYDRVLVDAPCSGVGTLRRRPELQTRRAPEDLASLASLQIAIVSRAAERVRPSGRMVYAVCSVLREEAEDVVAALVAARPELEPAPFEGAAARALAGDAPTLRLLPSAHGTDGYFLASLRRRSP